MIKKMKNIRAKMRVKKERNEIVDKLIDLYKYLSRPDAQQRDLLEKQEFIMRKYIEVLNERLSAWEEEK